MWHKIRRVCFEKKALDWNIFNKLPDLTITLVSDQWRDTDAQIRKVVQVNFPHFPTACEAMQVNLVARVQILYNIEEIVLAQNSQEKALLILLAYFLHYFKDLFFTVTAVDDYRLFCFIGHDQLGFESFKLTSYVHLVPFCKFDIFHIQKRVDSI